MLGGIASVAGTGWTFGAVAIGSLGHRRLGGGDAGGRARSEPQPLAMLVRARCATGAILLAIWFVVLPALLFGTLGVLGPLRLAELGFGAVAIGAIWLIAGVLETGNNVVDRPHRRPPRAARAGPRRR